MLIPRIGGKNCVGASRKTFTNNPKKLSSLSSGNLIHTRSYWEMIAEELLSLKRIFKENSANEFN